MDDAQLDRVAALAGDLPGNDIARLAHAATGGIPALNELRGNSANDRLRTACQTLIETIHHGADPLTLAGALLGSGATARRLRHEASVDVVWTGPTSEITTSRVTSAVIAELLDEACQVAITLLLERTADNPGYHQHSQPFPTLRARRLAWPAANRPTAGAALHAKVLDIDRHTALVISANITRWALDSNLECGILIRGGDHPRQIHDHIDSLAALGILVPVAR